MIALNKEWLRMMREHGAETTVVLDGKNFTVHYCYYHESSRVDIDYVEGIEEPTLEQLDEIASQIEDHLNGIMDWTD